MHVDVKWMINLRLKNCFVISYINNLLYLSIYSLHPNVVTLIVNIIMWLLSIRIIMPLSVLINVTIIFYGEIRLTLVYSLSYILPHEKKTYTHLRIHTCINTHTNSSKNTQSHTHTHTYTYTQSRTHTHTDIRTLTELN